MGFFANIGNIGKGGVKAMLKGAKGAKGGDGKIKGKKGDGGGKGAGALSALGGLGAGLSAAGKSLAERTGPEPKYEYNAMNAKRDKKGSDYRAGSPMKEEIY